ncbi:MAG: TIGR00269 family protein [Candidatus Micrarchaeia archaeon]
MPSCSFCQREACVFLAYMSRHFCAKHFKEFFEKRVRRTIREFGMLRGVKRLGIALSGGKDSLTALHILAPMAREMRIEVHAVTIDEGIRGYRDRLVAVARQACNELDVQHHVVSCKKEVGFSIDEVVALRKRETSCSYCGVFRRWALNRKARELGLDKIATGHNLDDVAQTVLMNILRNEPRPARFSPNGGLVEEEGFVDRIRPLFRTPEKEVALYALLKGLPVRFSECPHAHEAFRNEVRNFLNEVEAKHPGTKFKVVNALLSARRALAGSIAGPLERCPACGEPSSGGACRRCEMTASLARALGEGRACGSP